MDPNSIIKLLRQQRRQINDSFTSNSNNIDFAKTNIDYNNNIINKQQYQKEMLNNNNNNNNNNNSTFLVPSGYGNSNNTATNRLVTSYPNEKAYYDSLKMATVEANKNQISCQNYNYRMEYSNNNNNNNLTQGKSLLINQSPNSTSMPLFPINTVSVERQSSPSPATTPTTPVSSVSPILKLFAKQLLTLKLCNRETHSHLYGRHPNLKIWLKLLNVSSNTFDVSFFFV